jgi:predicted O-methyltransferase YrrM
LSRLSWRGQDKFEIDGVTYICRPLGHYFESTADTLCLCKGRAAAEELEKLLVELNPRRIVEVGLYEGGSAAMIAQLVRPEKLIGIDVAAAKPGVAAHFQRHPEGSISLHWEVDQADRERIRAILADELGDAELDLVIDDASHHLEPSRATFAELFPRLRPGGLYVLEDWSWAHTPIEVWPERDPLTIFVLELMIASAHVPEAIASLEVERRTTVITRGDAPLDPSDFDARDLLRSDRSRRLVDSLLREGAEPPRRRPWRRGAA